VNDDARERSAAPRPPVHRRQALKVLGLAVGSAALTPLVGLSGCARPAPDGQEDTVDRQPLRVPLDRLPVGERLTVQVAGTPVELHRTDDGVTGRSLRCTHFGCTVVWTPDRNAYVCPCHDGAYAPDGHVIYGPPPAPLATVAVTVEEGVVVVEPPPRGPAGEGAERSAT
jgi:Rieske Fe-S protein